MLAHADHAALHLQLFHRNPTTSMSRNTESATDTLRSLADKIPLLKGDEPRLVEHLVDRLLMGQGPYGVWMALAERRNLMGELRDELLDGVAYLCMDAISRADAQQALENGRRVVAGAVGTRFDRPAPDGQFLEVLLAAPVEVSP